MIMDTYHYDPCTRHRIALVTYAEGFISDHFVHRIQNKALKSNAYLEDSKLQLKTCVDRRKVVELAES